MAKNPRQDQLIQNQREAVNKLIGIRKELDKVQSIVMQLSPLLGAFEHVTSADHSLTRAILCLDDTGDYERAMDHRWGV